MSATRPKKPRPSVKIEVPKPKTTTPKKSAIPSIPRNSTAPVLSSAYNCLNNTGDLTFYLQEIGQGSKPFIFNLPPRAVGWKKPVSITELKTQGNITQPLYFSLAENRKLSLAGLIFDHDLTSLPHERLELLQSLQLPVGTKLRVFQLLVGNKIANQFAARSYGKFVISNLDISEQLRDVNTGKTVRAIVNLELTEVSSLQLDFGKDLSVPSTIVPTLPAELTGAGSGSNNASAGEPTPDSGNVIKAGTTVALVGFRGVAAGKSSSHLHMTYVAPGKTLDQTMEPLYATGQLPRFVQDAVSLGPYQSVPKKKLSELKTYSGLQRYRAFTKGPHRGADYQLTPLANVAMFKCPINIEVDMYFLSYEALPYSTLTLECFVKGYEGQYKFLHCEAIATNIDTTRKRVSSSQPNNNGGQTPTAIKQKNQSTL